MCRNAMKCYLLDITIMLSQQLWLPAQDPTQNQATHIIGGVDSLQAMALTDEHLAVYSC